ncbi:hypothetical protein [Collibacillus ludicampi]|uniref:hypothetical protein n=1 Tax=Collibacillus ludicampi TaxID=2771369 RepID=UPI002495377F|nr:hypothetical protein [Collibacillus ludicampi]
MISPVYCKQFIGRPVGVRLRDGSVHRGILHSVTDTGIHFRPLQGARTIDGDDTIKVDVLQNLPQSGIDCEKAFWPFFFLPFLAISLLWPLAFWW